LCPDGKLLGTTSYRAFVAEYAELLPRNHGQMKHIIEGIARRKRKRMEEIPDAWLPQLIAVDAMGAPRWKNLEKLQEMLKPYVFRVLKKDCLDLPEKIYQTYGFTMSASQQSVYEVAEQQLRFERDNGELDIFNALTKIIKLRQIVSGFIMLDGEATKLPALKDNPRMKLFLELVNDLDGPFIVWATFREELAQIAQALRDLGITCVEYHGGVKSKDRETAVDDFQGGRARAFVGQAQSGGLGLTLTAAETAIYYSNDYNSETRLQSEDRCHRIGTEHNVLYIDIVAEGTIDERIIAALRRKEDVANTVLNYI
jgi:SNF2 family DNA or RNA helicase